MSYPSTGTPTGQFRSGKGGRVSVGGTYLTQSKWSASWTAPDNPTTNFQSFNSVTNRSASEGVKGVEESAWTFAGNWNAAQIPFADPPAVYPRDNLVDLELWTYVNDGQDITYPYARVRSSNVACDVGGLVTVDASGMNQGDWTPPTANVT